MEENKRILDLTDFCNDEQFAAIKSGLEAAKANTGIRRYFGYADKRELKKICKWCGYVDKGAMLKGVLAAYFGMIGGSLVAIYLLEKRRKKPNEEIFVMSVAKDEESE